MGVTKKLKLDLETIGHHGQNFKVRASMRGDKAVNIDNRLTTFYESALEHLQLLDEYFPIFEGRIKRDPSRLKDLVLSVNRQINKVTP